MQVKPTEFNGVLYRSRTEARWAMFLTVMGIHFTYEAEEFALGDGTIYHLPDFWLIDQDRFLEIKGELATPEEWHKCAMLSIDSGKEVLLAIGSPDGSDQILRFPDEMRLHEGTHFSAREVFGECYAAIQTVLGHRFYEPSRL